MFKRIHAQLDVKTKKRIYYIGGVLLAVLCVMIISRVWAAIALRNETIKQAVPVVATIKVQKGPAADKLVLPGNVQAWHEAPVYARTSGYIKKWYVDIGSQVKAGDLLAEIETPELDAQLRQAVADLNTAEANNKLAQSTAQRWLTLLKTDSVSKQEADEKVSAAHALEATVNAARANRDRLQQLVGFEKVLAPFDGVITARSTDLGSLINAGSSAPRPLFRIAQADRLRVYVKVPQNYSASIDAKSTVQIRFAEHPGQLYPATLLQTANAIDPNTRTLLAQYVVDNTHYKLLPGGYTEVLFTMPLAANTVRLPVNTLIFQAAGLQVATLDRQNKIVLKPISINRDFGTDVEVTSGLVTGEVIVLNPSDSIFNGEQVRLAPPEQDKGNK